MGITQLQKNIPNRQVWMWLNIHCRETRNFLKWEINERGFSNLHPRDEVQCSSDFSQD